MPKQEIFISHAVADQKLAALLVEFLHSAIGVPQKAIFCTSVPGHGIPLTDDFNAYMKAKIQNPALVILLMTESYLESSFCLMELGAAWAKSHKTLPIVVPPVPFSKVGATLGLTQSLGIEDQTSLNGLRKTIRADFDLEERTDETWDKKRVQWRTDLKKVLKNLPKATKVAASDHDEVVASLNERNEEVESLEERLEEANARIKQLEGLKDKAEVKALKKTEAGLDGLRGEFDELIEAVKHARPEATSRVVFYHLLMDHYNKAGAVDWLNDSWDFNRAIEYNVFARDEDGERVPWSNQKLKKLKKAIEAVEEFIDSPDGRRLAKADDEDNWDYTDKGFWEDRLSM